LIERVGRRRKVVVVFSAEAGCADCEVFEELIKREGLEKFVDFIVYIPSDEDSLSLAVSYGIEAIPVVYVYEKGSTRRYDDPDPHVLLENLKKEISGRIQLYSDLKKLYFEHAQRLSTVLGRKVVVNEDIIPLIVARIEEYGLPYCPCRTELTPQALCPCYYHIEEIKRYGKCRCGLFRVVEV